MFADEEDLKWLYRGVPIQSREVRDVNATGEIEPPCPERRGARWRQCHVAGATETAYTSWTSDRSIAVAAAEQSAAGGRIVVFKVSVDSLDQEKVFDGRADESEYLIEGLVEGVQRSFSEDEDEDQE